MSGFLTSTWGPVLVGAIVTGLIVGVVVFLWGGAAGAAAAPAPAAPAPGVPPPAPAPGVPPPAPGAPPGRFLTMLIGADGRASTSKTTAAAWTLVVVFVIASILARAVGTGDLPPSQLQNLGDSYLLLLGGPFAALVLAKGITVSRLNGGSLTKTVQTPVFDPTDLASDDTGKTDVFDAQFLMFNLLGIAYVVAAFLARPADGLPDLPVAVAGLTSISALTYTANKSVAKSGPAITGASYDAATTTVSISGANLEATGNVPMSVQLDGNTVATNAGATSTGFAFAVPAATPAGPHTVVVTVPTGSGGAMQAAATVVT